MENNEGNNNSDRRIKFKKIFKPKLNSIPFKSKKNKYSGKENSKI